jgi:hypothetical protein
MAGGHNGRLEREWLDRGRLPCVTERHVRPEGSEARVQAVPAHPCDVPHAGVIVNEGPPVSTGPLKAAKRVHEPRVQSCQCGTAFDRHPDGSAVLSGARDTERERLLVTQRVAGAVQHSIKIFQSDELLRQRDVREVPGVETKPSRLARRQTRTQVNRSLTNLGRWQNGYVECE